MPTVRDDQVPALAADPRAMRALAHPVRLALLEALGRRGPLTATQAGQLVGESATTCSFHLRTLARYGFVEEAGRGPGRERPWRRTSAHIELDAHNRDVMIATVGIVQGQADARHLAWLQGSESFPAEWREAAIFKDRVLHLTAAELAALEADIDALLEPFLARQLHPKRRPAGALPIEFNLKSYPIDGGS